MNEYPERIPHDVWMNTQMSIARFYGGIQLNGKFYLIEKATGDLVCKTHKAKEKRTKKTKP